MTGTYDVGLVALSVVIAIFASFAALDLAGRISASRQRSRLFWLFGGASAMGLGIWCMHYVGMLAFRMPMNIFYNVPTVLLSLLAAIGASVVALFTVSRRQMGLQETTVGGVVMGSGIAAMHYVGMAAMRMPSRVSYNIPLVATSIVLAVVISIVALVLAFRIRDEKRLSVRKVVSAIVMGSAIPVMHYTGMFAATFRPSEAPVDISHAVSISSLGVAVISVSTLLILSFVIIGAFLDRLISAQKDLTKEAQSELRDNMQALVESEQRLRVVTDNARVGLVIVNPERRYIYANHAYAELFDLPSSAIVGQRVSEVLSGVYEDQIRPRLDRAFAGERVAYELYKQSADGGCHYEIRYEPSAVNGAVQAVVVVVTDLTERKNAERASLQLATIVEFSDDAIIGKDLNSIVTSWNRGAEKIFGYSASEMVGTSIMRLIPADRQGEENHILANIRSGKSVEHFETQRQTKDGRLIDISVTASPIKDATGKPIGVSKIARDITERKRAETRLIESECKFRSLFDNANDAIFILRDGVFADCNVNGSELFGVTRERLIGQSPSLFSPPIQPDGRRSQEKALELMQRALTGEPQLFEWVHQRPDGATIYTDVRLSRFELHGEPYLQGVARDITERKKAQEQIAEQAALLDKARDAILVRDLGGSILFWNSGAERIYGWARQEALGRNVGELLYSNPKQFEDINGLAIRQGEWHGELQHLTRDKKQINIEARWTLIRDHEGNPKSVLAINTDITDKKKIEAQFLRAQRMESIGTLAGGIAHDLNNILAPIILSIEFLKTISDHPQAKKILETIDVSAKRGSDIVRQVLSFARGLEGKRIEVQPKHLLKDLENIIKDTFPRDIRLQFSIPNDTWTILGDPTQVHQILLNLCVNARDAMSNGGSLAVGVENCVFDEQYAAMNIEAKVGRYVGIHVTDSGVGIPRDILNKIFEPFFTTKEVNKGTGLGLSTVMAIVKSHGGFVTVYSELGKGTTFKVYLPALERSSEAREHLLQKAKLPRGNGETVLVIDDEDSILTVTSQTLQAFGYAVLTATNGAEALAVYVQHKTEIAIVLTDMMMPIMDGAATIQALFRINPAVKIIAASGLRANGDGAQTSDASIKHFLTKPYTAEALLTSIRAILDKSEKPLDVAPAMP
jgi:PAS domain S-box-containing protein